MDLNNKKKVLHIVESFGSGVYIFLVDLINCTINDFEIIVAYGERKETPKNFKQDFSNKVKFIKIENFTRSIDLRKDITALKEIKKIIKEEKPDIVHLHSSKAGILGRLAISGKKVRMFYNPHGFSFLKKDDSNVKRFVYWFIEKLTAMFNRKCTIIGCSKGEYLEARKLNKNSICINNGIDIKKLEEETRKVKEIAYSNLNNYTVEQNKYQKNLKEVDCNNLKICTVGRIGYQKNPKLFNRIAESMPNLQFTWIGDGDLKEELKSPNIKITGWKIRQEVLEILNEQDVFILTSLWEGLPISLLEAMYMKKICIVSNCIGNRDVIEDGINGYIAKELEEFINIIKNMKDNQTAIRRLTEKAREDVLSTYCNEVIVKQYKEIYLKE